MMPSTSKKQHNFMEAVAHNPAFAKKAGVPQSVGKDFSKADKGKTFKQGGDMATTKMGKPVMKPGMSTAMLGMKKMSSGGLAAGHKSANGIASKGKTKGKNIVMAGSKGMKAGGATKKYC
jgi:hypothetical protein